MSDAAQSGAAQALPPWALRLGELAGVRLGWRVSERDLATRLAALGAAAAIYGGPERFIETLQASPTRSPSWRDLIDKMANGQTSFMRDRLQLETLLEVAAGQRRSSEPLSIWCAGCSSGEEPYSVAILCLERGLQARILGTDVNATALLRAEEGSYSDWALRHVPEELRRTYFERDGESFVVSAAVRRLVGFQRHNLFEDEAPAPKQGGWDAVLCRNVFIYLSPKSVEEVAARLGRVLAPRGQLCIAASETFFGLSTPFVATHVSGQTLYSLAEPSRPLDAPRPRPPPAPATPAVKVAAKTPAPPPPSATPADPLQDLLAQVELLARRGDVAGARALMQAQPPGSVLYRLVLGHLCLKLHDIDAALAEYERAAELDQLVHEAHYFYGLAARKAGRWADAEQAFRRALFLAPGLWQAAYLLSTTLERQGRRDEAKRELANARRTLEQGSGAVGFVSPELYLSWWHIDATALRVTG